MNWAFETLGNAIVQVFKDGKPVLVTDPWPFGAAYDSDWANDYRITWPDMKRLWGRSSVALIPPFSTIEIPSGKVLSTDCDTTADPALRVRPEALEDWDARLTPDEWSRVAQFYPLFTPRVAKLGGNAKVVTPARLWKFRLKWLSQSPAAFLGYRVSLFNNFVLLPWIRSTAEALGIFPILKSMVRRIRSSREPA